MRDYTIWFVCPTSIEVSVTSSSIISLSISNDFFYFIPNPAKIKTVKWRSFKKFSEKMESLAEKKILFNEYASPMMKQVLQGF